MYPWFISYVLKVRNKSVWTINGNRETCTLASPCIGLKVENMYVRFTLLEWKVRSMYASLNLYERKVENTYPWCMMHECKVGNKYTWLTSYEWKVGNMYLRFVLHGRKIENICLNQGKKYSMYPWFIHANIWKASYYCCPLCFTVRWLQGAPPPCFRELTRTCSDDFYRTGVVCSCLSSNTHIFLHTEVNCTAGENMKPHK